MLPVFKTTRNYNSGLVDYFLSNNLMDDFWKDEVSTYSPNVNIAESDKGFNIELAAPGMDKKDFNINVEDKVLTISYESKEENEERNDEIKYLRREFRSSSFKKSYTLPDNVNGDKISAKYENGILNVEIPKVKEQSKLSRLIKIA